MFYHGGSMDMLKYKLLRFCDSLYLNIHNIIVIVNDFKFLKMNNFLPKKGMKLANNTMKHMK